MFEAKGAMCGGSGDLTHVICVTNRHLAAAAAGLGEDDVDSPAGQEAFLTQLRRVAQRKPVAVILREKDLTVDAYRMLARDALAICRAADVPCILHTFADVAAELDADGLHLPLPLLRETAPDVRQTIRTLGASCHSAADVREAAALGCTYVTVGHIFATDCKKGLPPRGLACLQDSCAAAGRMKVYAIGGITRERMTDVLAAGAAGGCVMSGLMTGHVWRA